MKKLIAITVLALALLALTISWLEKNTDMAGIYLPNNHKQYGCLVVKSEPFNSSFRKLYTAIEKMFGPNTVPFVFIDASVFDQSQVVENIDHATKLLEEGINEINREFRAAPARTVIKRHGVKQNEK